MAILVSLAVGLPAVLKAAPSTNIVISQVYGGGGNSGATYKNDFIELHNISSSPVSVAGWSVQYASATGSTWALTSLTGSIPAGGYYLVQEGAGAGGTTSLPAPDATGSLNLSGTAGKVALCNTATALSGTASSGGSIVDFVGFGLTANSYEGTGPTPAPSNATSVTRKDSGSTDTDQNASDFTAGAVVPHNASTPIYMPGPVASQVRVETLADGSGSVVAAQSISAGSSVTVFSNSRSSGNSFIANAAATWSLTSLSGGVVAADLVPAGDGKSAVFTPHASGSAVIHASISGLNSVDSGVIAATAAPINPSAVASASATEILNSQNVTLTVSVTPGANPNSSGITVTGDLSSIGGSSTQSFTSGVGNTFTYVATVPANLAGGPKLLNFTVSDEQGRSAAASLTLNLRGALTIFHTNDTHARVTPHKWIVPQHTFSTASQFEDVGGISYMGSKVLSLTAVTPDALVLDGGDISEGNPIGDWNGPGFMPGSFGNGTIVDYYKMLDAKLKLISGRGGRGLDAMVVGNHDIRDISYMNNMKAASAQFPVISMNICNKGTHTPYYSASTILNINGNKIGVVGYTTESADSPETDVNNLIDVVKCDWSSSDSTKIHFADVVNDLRNNQGCNMVILLTHMGHSGLCTVTGANPTPILVDNAVAKLPEVVVSGHWHTYCDTVWQPTSLNYKTIFTEAGSFQHYVGELKINGLGRLVSSNYYPLRNSDITPDSDIASYLQTRKDQYAATNPPYGVDQVVGYTSDNLLLDNYMKWWSADEYPWSGNNTAGNWICDAVQRKATSLFGQCDLSLEAGGGVRSDIIAGPVKYTHIYETFPWADDTIYVVNMTGQQIWNFFKDHNCDAAMSAGWLVTAYDGVPTAISINGSPIDLGHTYKVAINNYMYLHDASNFATIDPAPQTSTYLARTALMDYTATFDQANPYQAGPSRYSLNTEFSGGYRVVVTMMNDNDSREAFKDGFIRFLSATPETLAHRGTQQVPTDLVNADGSINRANRLSENEWYRSYLGFRSGALKPGDIVEVWGKGAFYGGNPEFVDQEGVQSDGVEFKIVGHDPSLAQPTYFSSISGFWNQTYKNHYVKFVARKSGTSSVTDKSGTTITIQDATGYATKTLPGNTGDYLVITGVPTSESYGLRFRADNVTPASTPNFPPDSQVNSVAPNQTSSPLALTATANAAPGSNQTFYSLEPVADVQVESGVPGSNFNTTNLYIQSAAAGSFQNERAWLRFDLSSLPAGSTITSATLNMSCWKATGASLDAEVRGGNDDTWGETAITWNNQPTFGSVLDTQTLVSGVTNLYYSWDATAFAQSKLAGNKLVSLLVKPVTENSTDATSPSYGFDSKEYASNHPYLQVTTPFAGTPVTVTQVRFFYRYSADNATWTAWSPFQTVSGSPWNATFSYPNGDGHYEFYSVATDSNGTVEPAPPYADTAVTYTSGTAVIAVEQNGSLSNGASVNFGNTEVNTSNPLTFTIRNSGNQTLTGLSVTIDPSGPNAADFAISTAPATSVSAAATSDMVVTFNPQAVGPRGAAIHIASSDSANNPFNILLNGNCLSHLEAWRMAHYGSANNTGDGADLATPANDGIPNLIKFATAISLGTPGTPGTQPVSIGNDGGGGGFTFSYARAKNAVADGIEFALEWSDSLTEGTWSSSGVVVQATVDQGISERITASIPMGSGDRRFVRLRVTRP